MTDGPVSGIAVQCILLYCPGIYATPVGNEHTGAQLALPL